jgi:hypothetical protein
VFIVLGLFWFFCRRLDEIKTSFHRRIPVIHRTAARVKRLDRMCTAPLRDRGPSPQRKKGEYAVKTIG